MSSTLIVRILNEIDDHVRLYNEWADDLRVCMNPKTALALAGDLWATHNFAIYPVQTTIAPALAPGVLAIGGVKIEIVYGMPDDEFLVISLRKSYTDELIYRISQVFSIPPEYLRAMALTKIYELDRYSMSNTPAECHLLGMQIINEMNMPKNVR